MENLDRMSSGLSYFDSNNRSIDAVTWSTTPLGSRSTWPTTLTAYVNFICTLPHCSAVFWGPELCLVCNIAWGSAMPSEGVSQGKPASECFSGEGLGSLRTSMKGHTVKVASEFLLEETPQHQPESPVLLSPLLNEHGARIGVLAQLFHSHLGVERPLDDLLNKFDEDERQSRTDEKTDKYNIAQVSVNAGSRASPNREQRVSLKENRLFRRFAQILPTGLAILDEHAEALFVNDDFYKLTTHKGSKSFRAWPESIAPDDYSRVMSAYEKAIKTNNELTLDFRCADLGNEENTPWRRLNMRSLEDDGSGLIVAIVDISEVKAAELAQRKAAEEARARHKQQESFIDMVSHEIRNPLSAILHSASEVQEACGNLKKRDIAGYDDDISTILEAADTIALCAAHQNSLVDDILSFSKLDASMLTLTPSSVELSSAFGKSTKLFTSEMKSNDIVFDYVMDVSYDDLKIDYVMADIRRLRQVLVNLLSNAIKFTKRKNGHRQISLKLGASTQRPTTSPHNQVYFESSPDQHRFENTGSSEWGNGETLYVTLAVEDTGVGMTDDEQKKLFQKFSQSSPRTNEQYGGSGLGLFISKKLCQLHGGEIGVSSMHGEGSTFAFFFKAKRTDRPAEEKDISTEDANLEATSEESGSTIADRVGAEARTEPESTAYPRLAVRPTAQPDEDKPWGQAVETSRGAGAADSPLEARNPPTATAGNKEAHILLVEDNAINAKILGRQLQNKGFQVMTAHNGQEAVDMVRRISSDKQSSENDQRVGPLRATAKAFDCILMDQEMPIKNGDLASQEIRCFNASVPILGVSANARSEQIENMMASGMSSVISKPFQINDLIQRITGLIHDGTKFERR